MFGSLFKPKKAWTEDQITRLRLLRTDGVGPVTYRKMMEKFSTPEAALAALPGLARNGGRTAPVRIPSAGDIRRELDRTAAFGARLVWANDPDYPRLLARTDTAPAVITVLGDLSLLNQRTIAVVGARNASSNGKQLAETLAHDLAAVGIVVISGMARGIDAAAHKGALRGGRTVAVIAGGIDVIYPAENAALQRRVAECGLVIAEASFGAAPLARLFPRRNRIIAGMALGTVVIEAALRSGSLTTARFAIEFNREVFAVPGSPLDERCHGSNDLLRKGATLVESAEDVLAELPADPAFERWMPPPEPLPEPPPGPLPDDAEVRRIVFEHLSYDPTSVDSVIIRSGLPTQLVTVALFQFELAGRVEFVPGGRVIRID